MDREKQLFSAIEAVHAAGARQALWQAAMDAILAFSRVRAVTLDTFDRKTLSHAGFQGAGMRPTTRSEYTNMGGAINARAVYAVTNRARLFSDRDVFGGEDGIDGDPFYNQFLVHHDVRYMAIGRVAQSERTNTYLSFCRSPKLGPVEDGDLTGIEVLIPHLRQTLSVSARLRDADARAKSFSNALDWLSEGMALMDRDGRILHANEAFEEIACTNDGLRVKAGAIVLESKAAQHNLHRALGAAIRVRKAESFTAPADFIVPRPSGVAAYIASVRPVLAGEDGFAVRARAIVFLRDPLRATGPQSFAHLDLTPAEVDLADALVRGLSPSGYARQRGVSINTVYTHLRRMKDKLGGKSLTALIRRLNAARAPVRPSLSGKKPELPRKNGVMK